MRLCEVKGGKNAPKRMDSQRLERADSKTSTDGETSWMSLACWPVPLALGRTPLGNRSSARDVRHDDMLPRSGLALTDLPGASQHRFRQVCRALP